MVWPQVFYFLTWFIVSKELVHSGCCKSDPYYLLLFKYPKYSVKKKVSCNVLMQEKNIPLG